jgi:hypothetical protein
MGLNWGIGQIGGGGGGGQDEMSMDELKAAYPGQSDATYQGIQDNMGWSGGFSTWARRNMSKQAWSSYDWGAAWRNEKPWFSQSRRRGRQSGGYIDNIPALLTGGEFVVGRNAVQHYGTGYLNQINRMQDGGLVGNTAFNQGGGALSAPSTAPTTNHNNVGITVNFGADASPEVKTVQSGAQEDPKMFAGKIRAAVLDVINQEQRVGGRLRSQRKGRR